MMTNTSMFNSCTLYHTTYQSVCKNQDDVPLPSFFLKHVIKMNAPLNKLTF